MGDIYSFNLDNKNFMGHWKWKISKNFIIGLRKKKGQTLLVWAERASLKGRSNDSFLYNAVISWYFIVSI